MKKFSGPIARRYGSALFDSALDISQKSGTAAFEKFIELVHTSSQAFDKKTIALFKNPNLSSIEKNTLLTALVEKLMPKGKYYFSELASFLNLLVENQRIDEIHTIANFFFKKADEFLGLTRVSITAAHQLTQNEIQDLESALARTLDKKIISHFQEDPSLLAGFIVKIGNMSVDASLKYRLSHLKESLGT